MTFWWWLTQHAATTALLIAVVTIVCRLMPKRPALHHALWVVVLIKFMMPSALAWPWSVTDVRRMILPTFAINALPFAERSEAVADGPPVTSRVAPTRQEPAAASDAREQRLETPASDVAASERLIAAAKTDAISAADHASDSADVALSTSVPNRVRPAENITRWWLPLITPLVCGAWLLGGFVMGLAQLRRIRGHWRLVRRAGIAPWHLTQEIAALARELGVRPIPALVAGGITSPFVWCLGPLRVIWPEHLANEAALGRLRGVIAHELAHVRRHDHWVAWLELLVGVVWWWNPLVWFVRRRLHESAEMACDALAVSVLSDGLRAYAEAFLELSLPLRMSEPAPALGVGSRDHNSFERRLTMILSNRVASRVSSPGLLAVAVLAILATPNWALGQIESKGAASTPSSESPQPPAKPDPDDPFGQPKPVVAAPLAAESSQPKPVSAEPKPGGNEAKSGANVDKFVTAEAELAAVKAERAALSARKTPAELGGNLRTHEVGDWVADAVAKG